MANQKISRRISIPLAIIAAIFITVSFPSFALLAWLVVFVLGIIKVLDL